MVDLDRKCLSSILKKLKESRNKRTRSKDGKSVSWKWGQQTVIKKIKNKKCNKKNTLSNGTKKTKKKLKKKEDNTTKKTKKSMPSDIITEKKKTKTK